MTTVASLFDGIGGTPLAARLSGAACLWCSEIEKFPQMVTKHHFPSMKHYGDITKINGAKVEPVDIIVGGSPCQDLSVAGKRQGMKHADFGDEETTRSGLFMEQIRIVKEMRDATETNQPRFMVWENVPGAFSSNNGEDFRAVIEETARIADSTVSIPRSVNGWANAGSILADGFSISWRTFDAQYWGVPQRRRRIYLVADFGGQSAPEILFEREGGNRYSKTVSTGTLRGRNKDTSGCLRTRSGQFGRAELDLLIYDYEKNTVRILTPIEFMRLQGFPDDWCNVETKSDSKIFKGGGNSFAMPNILFVIQRCVEVTRCEP